MMRKFIKENLVLLIGLTFPLLLILIFFVSTVIPKLTSQPPQYEMLFTTVAYDYQNRVEHSLDFSVKSQQLMIKVKSKEEKDRNYDVKRLMAYDAKTDSVHEISIDISNAALVTGDSVVALPETRGMLIDSAIVSPDGYTLDGPNYSGGGLVGGIFGGSNRDNGFRLKKGNIGYKIPNTQQSYTYNQVQFVGWIIKK